MADDVILCNLDDVKAWMSIPLTELTNDGVLNRLIAATSSDFMREIERPDFYPAQDYSETREGDGGDSIVLRHWPLNSIDEVSIDGSSTDGFYIDEDLDPERRWESYLTDAVFPDRSVVEIQYNAGYTAVPRDVEQANIDWVSYRFKARQWIGQASQALYQSLSTHTPETEIPLSVKRVIERYRRFDPLQIPAERVPVVGQKLSKQVISVEPKA